MRTTELRLRVQTPFVIGKTEELDCANPANHRIIYADTNEYPWVVNGVNATDAGLKRTPIYLKGCSATSSSQEDSPQIDIHPMKGRLESNNIYPTQQSGSRLRHYQHINSTASPANITPNPGTFEFTQAGAWYGPFTFSTSLPLLSMLAVFNPNDDTPLIESRQWCLKQPVPPRGGYQRTADRHRGQRPLFLYVRCWRCCNRTTPSHPGLPAQPVHRHDGRDALDSPDAADRSGQSAVQSAAR